MYMILRTHIFRHQGEIPPRFTCDGANVNPILIIEDVRRDAKSLVLIVDDPDATRGVTFTHWIVWNIPSQTIEIKEGEVPKGALQGRNDFGEEKYGGPCPPRGSKQHRYMFKLYALDKALDLPAGSEKDKLERAMERHILEQTTLMGLYARVV